MGVIIGGLITLYASCIQHKYNKKLKDQEVILQRLEEVNKLMEDIDDAYKTFHIHAVNHYTTGNKLDFNFKKEIRFIRLKTIINFYFSDLIQYVDLLGDTLESFTIALLELGSSKNKVQKEKSMVILVRANYLIENISKSILRESSIIARKFIN
jgi:hypothetical protein